MGGVLNLKGLFLWYPFPSIWHPLEGPRTWRLEPRQPGHVYNYKLGKNRRDGNQKTMSEDTYIYLFIHFIHQRILPKMGVLYFKTVLEGGGSRIHWPYPYCLHR